MPLYLVPLQQGLRVMELFVLKTVSIHSCTFCFDVNVTSVSGVIKRKPTGRIDQAETLSLSWKKHHQLAGKLRKLFGKVTSENILLLRDPSSIYWESAS